MRLPHTVASSLKTYNGNERLGYMDSQIDLSHEDFKRVILSPNREKFSMDKYRQGLADSITKPK